MWRKIRINGLLIVLATITKQLFLDQADLDWEDNFYVALYPINADGSEAVADYIKGVTKADFEAIEVYFAEEAAHYKVFMRRSFAVELGGGERQNRPC